jgi:hypothetical protein
MEHNNRHNLTTTRITVTSLGMNSWRLHAVVLKGIQTCDSTFRQNSGLMLVLGDSKMASASHLWPKIYVWKENKKKLDVWQNITLHLSVLRCLSGEWINHEGNVFLWSRYSAVRTGVPSQKKRVFPCAFAVFLAYQTTRYHNPQCRSIIMENISKTKEN